MEKAKQLEKQKTHTKKPPQNNNIPNKTNLWDCGSSLYDSFELKSFERQLSSALVSRTLSMPHLSEPKPKHQPITSSSINISSSIRRIFRSIFKPRICDNGDGIIKLARNDGGSNKENKSRAGPNVVYYDAISTKRDAREFDFVFARMSSNVAMRRSGSVADANTRRAATSLVGISCTA